MVIEPVRKTITIWQGTISLDPNNHFFFTEKNLDALLNIEDKLIYYDILRNINIDAIDSSGIVDFHEYLPLTMENINIDHLNSISSDDLNRINGKAYHLYAKMRIALAGACNLLMSYHDSPLEEEFYTVKNLEAVINSLNYINIRGIIYNNLIEYFFKNKLSILDMYLELISEGKVNDDEVIKQLINKLQSKLFSISVCN